MSTSTMGLDAYQLTTLVAHADADRLEQRVVMSFFFRKLPAARNYVVCCGLRSLIEHARQMRFEEDELRTLAEHPLIGPALLARPSLMDALRALDGFRGDIDALPEGTLAFAGPALSTDGKPLSVYGTPLKIYTPMLQVRTDMLRAKLIETPWLSRLNHMSMVASKAARVVGAAGGRPVLEFGTRRTHPAAAVDAAYAAYLAGCAGTSNIAAQHIYGVPATGTMDHFAVQAAARPDVPVGDTEEESFAGFYHAFPAAATLLIDTYDTERGIRRAVAATDGKLQGIRIDSNVTPESVAEARALLDELGAPHARIFVSDALDEWRVRALPLVDGFGVGENITCSPDSAVGIGAVAKLVVNGYGQITMKLSRGSGKATLPGELQVWRYADHDLVALAGEAAPAGGRALLEPLWRDRGLVAPLPSLEESRARVRAEWQALPERVRALEPADPPWPLVASDRLVALIRQSAEAACGVRA
jgi:nicotinate phosphoribosyltransferase